MSKKSKNLLGTFMIGILMLLMSAFTVQASDIGLQKTNTLTLYSKKDTYTDHGYKQNPNKQNLCYVFERVSNQKSSKASVASVTKESDPVGDAIYVHLKKEGTTTVSFKKGSKTYKTKVVVKKYTSPVVSVKVGKTTLNAAKFKNRAVRSLKYSDYANKNIKIYAKPKAGWSIIAVNYSQNDWRKSENVKNGSSIRVAGGKGFLVTISAMNAKTGQMENLVLRFV